MHIVVTGGSGKIGAYVVRNLVAHGHTVINADNAPPKEPVSGATFVRTDTTDFGQVVSVMTFRGTRADAVIHLAAIPNVYPQNAWPAPEVWRINALGVYHVAEACAQLGIARMAEASSINVHQFGLSKGAVAPPRWPIDETMPYYTINAYGLSKIAGEGTMRMLHARTGAQAISIRPAGVIAPGEYERRIAGMRERGASFMTASYADTRDLADAFRLAVERDGLGCEAIYAVNDEAFSAVPVAPVLREQYTDAYSREIAITGDAADVSNAKAKRLLGWQPRHHWRDEDK